MSHLDLKDRRLLFELDLNARQPVSYLARKLRLSRDVVNYRIKRLEENNIIRGYRTIIDTSKLGYTFYRVLFKLFNCSGDDEQALIEFLKKEPNVWWIATLDGLFDFNFAVWVKDEHEMFLLQKRLYQKFKSIIKESLVCPVIRYTQLSRNYFLNQKVARKEIIIGTPDVEILDAIDLNILKMIAIDARISLVNISSKVRIDPIAVKHRIKKLESKEIIKGYKLDLNFTNLKRDFYSVKINLNSLDQLMTIIEYVKSIPEVNGIIESLGSYDIEFDLEVEDSERYYEIIAILKKRFYSIREIVYFRVLKNFKVLFMPEI
ncbi:MAG: Lrp/AsnC family transcriptional regulator [Nanoarchaeota archaeon]|nr:Lrp/AsnC family transcriptional regulator [Nanoarchaeota archaeon]